MDEQKRMRCQRCGSFMEAPDYGCRPDGRVSGPKLRFLRTGNRGQVYCAHCGTTQDLLCGTYKGLKNVILCRKCNRAEQVAGVIDGAAETIRDLRSPDCSKSIAALIAVFALGLFLLIAFCAIMCAGPGH